MWVPRKALAAVAIVWAGVSGVRAADFGAAVASADARYVAQWVIDSRDNRSRPFVIVDKKDAKVFVFGPGGQMLGATPALLGMARGDHSVPGIGALPPAQIPIADRTTPAGRYETEPGINLNGEDVIWIDYDAGLAIHRLRPDAAQRTRLRRLASGSPDAHRVSAGCVVLPVSFYDDVLRPLFERRNGVVYVLPETRPVRELLAELAAAM